MINSLQTHRKPNPLLNYKIYFFRKYNILPLHHFPTTIEPETIQMNSRLITNKQT
jgi:hypothetical protein